MISKKKKKFPIRNTLISIALLIFFIFLFSKPFLTSPESDLNCKIIFENPGDNKIEIALLTNNLPETKTIEYSEVLLNSEPFNENKEKFNFYYAGESNCSLIDKKALFCYSKELIKKASKCPNDYIIVLSEQPKNIRSSAYMKVLSINTQDTKNVLIHEFAHLFSNLADEYVPSTIPWGSENCAKDCQKFERYPDLEGCYQGCSKSNYYRSNENTIMRTLKTDEFGKLNTEIIKEDLEKYE